MDVSVPGCCFYVVDVASLESRVGTLSLTQCDGSYWFKYIIVTPNQLTAAALVIQYWLPPEKVNPGVFIAIFLVVIICINYFGVRFFGEFEFWLSSFKIITIVAVILLCFVLACGGGPDHDPKGFRYWKDPG
jgi:amino acid transporter